MRNLGDDILRFNTLIFILCLIVTPPALAQWMGKQTGCYADSIVANPNRPTVANPADITQYGVLELEYGFDRFWPEPDVRLTSVGGLLKFGLLCDVELRWNTTSFLSQTDAGGTHRSFGDNWLGPQIRLYKQTPRVPSLSFSYAVKIPSASADDGLGTGRFDHAFTLLVSKDIAKIHFDFNATEFLIGRPGTSGFDKNQQLNLAFSHFVHGGLQFTGEFWGDTRLNQSTPGFRLVALGAHLHGDPSLSDRRRLRSWTHFRRTAPARLRRGNVLNREPLSGLAAQTRERCRQSVVVFRALTCR